MLKLISLNIEGNKHLIERVLPFLARESADIICLQEVFQCQVSLIEATLGVSGEFLPMAEVRFPTKHTPEPLGAWGVYMASRRPVIASGKAWYKGSADEPLPVFLANNDPNAIHRGLVWLMVMHDDVEYTVATTHFTWSAGGQATPEQCRRLKKLLAATRPLPPHVLCGDFNAPRGGELYQELTRHYVDALPPEITTTLDPHWHYSQANLQLVVDYLLTQPVYRARRIRVVDGVSDHQAIVAEIERQ